MPKQQHQNPRLLAIDDSALIHRLLRARLRGERIDIHTAATGREGLAMAVKLVPEVILLDFDMADMDGHEVLRKLKADPRTHDIPVIFLSDSTDTAEKVRGLEMGAVDFIIKPVEMAELIARVRSAVQIRLLIKMLAERARLDALTGLWNRAYFDERLQQEVAEAKRHGSELALIFTDLDNFKDLNDECGHPFGDHVLQQFAELLNGGRTGDVACRYGGEEFVVILPRAAADEAAKVAERARRALRAMNWPGHPRLTVTASFGIADLTCVEKAAAGELVASADRALYTAKRMGRDRVHIAAPQRGRASA